MPTATLELSALQRLLYRLITSPSGVAEGLANERALPVGGLPAIIAGDDRMSAEERVGIYANGYFFRILGVLKEDYPATLAVTGADHFHNLVTGYLVEYPPSEPSIYYAGRYLADYLGSHPSRQRWPFLAELARLERAVLESFHAVDAAALDAGAMRAIAPAEWPSIVMRIHPAARILECGWRVDLVLRAVEEETPWAMPDHNECAILVWRRDARVYYRALEGCEGAALKLAQAESGATFAAICEAVAARAGDDAAALINQMLARWLGDGVLTIAETPVRTAAQ